MMLKNAASISSSQIFGTDILCGNLSGIKKLRNLATYTCSVEALVNELRKEKQRTEKFH